MGFFDKSKKSKNKKSDQLSTASSKTTTSRRSKTSIISGLFGSSSTPAEKLHKHTISGDLKKFMMAVEAIKNGGDPSAINTVNKNQQTVLHVACQEGRVEIVKILIHQTKIKLNLLDSKQKTALMLAVENQSFQIVEELVKKEADVDLKDYAGNTALHLSCKIASVGISKILIVQAESNVNMKNADGQTPLHLAIPSASTVLINLLLQNKALINAKDIGGRTPLMIASYIGLYNIVKHLDAKGAYKYATDINGRNAYDHAMIAKFPNIADLLGTGPADASKQTKQILGRNGVRGFYRHISISYM